MNIVVFVNPKQEINEFWEDVITNTSEDDKSAIEYALQLKEKKGGKTTAVAYGGEEADTALREAFAMGVDHAVWIKGEDSSTNKAETIAAELKKLNGDVVVLGYLDNEIKELLNLPIKTGSVNSLDLPEEDQSIVLVNTEEFTPRYMSIKGVYTAYKREIETIVAL